MHITDYPLTQTLTNENVFLVDGPTGTKTILAPDALKAQQSLLTTPERLAGLDLTKLQERGSLNVNQSFLVGDSNMTYRLTCDTRLIPIIMDTGGILDYGKWSIFRGISLGSVITDDQWTEIKNGTFRGLFVGDYWTIGGVQYNIIDFDYWYRKGGTGNLETNHHVLIAPLITAQFHTPVKMQTTLTSSGAYVGTNIESNVIPNEALPKIEAAFGAEHILDHRHLLGNATDNNGNQTGITWKNAKVIIPNETMIFGTRNFSSRTTNAATLDLDSSMQCAYWRLQSRWLPRRNTWLQDVVNSTQYTVISVNGTSSRLDANKEADLMPVFAIYQPAS